MFDLDLSDTSTVDPRQDLPDVEAPPVLKRWRGDFNSRQVPIVECVLRHCDYPPCVPLSSLSFPFSQSTVCWESLSTLSLWHGTFDEFFSLPSWSQDSASKKRQADA